MHDIDDMEIKLTAQNEDATYKQRMHAKKLQARAQKRVHSRPKWKQQLSAHKTAATIRSRA